MRAPAVAVILVLCTGLVTVASSSLAGGPEKTETQAPEKARAPHPEPRVIVNIKSVNGPHRRKDVERAARLAWGRIVRCYETTGRGERGGIDVELVISGGGKVTNARRTRSDLKNADLSKCLVRAMKGLSMPTAHARSTAKGEIRVAPGDPPSSG